MIGPIYCFIALRVAAFRSAQLRSGRDLGAWWFPATLRALHFGTYCAVVPAEAVILIAFLTTARTWNFRCRLGARASTPAAAWTWREA